MLLEASHGELRAGLPKDEALRQAMLQVRNDPRTSYPRYWAAFLLAGDPRPLTLRKAEG